MRVFEKKAEDSVWRVEFGDGQIAARSRCVAGQCKGEIGGEWHIMDCLKDCIWREIEPFDITKLDTAGVFHEYPVRCFHCETIIERAGPDSFSVWEIPSGAVVFHDGGNYGSSLYDSACPGGTHVDVLICDDCLKDRKSLVREWEPTEPAEPTPYQKDVAEFEAANATIAELRARVAELEGQVTKANNRAEMEFLERQLAATKRIEHYDNCLCELRRQLQTAWMRGDLKTADRIADLIGDNRPSEHEAADAGEVRA